MKKTIVTTLLVTIMTLIPAGLKAQSCDNEEAMKNLKPYPEVVDSLERHVILLSEKDNEESYKIELIAGKNLEVDCNRHRFLGAFESADVQGWGYTYYKFVTDGQTVSTMMACNEPNTVKFVAGEPLIIRYNSRLPVVVYLPEGMELKYRIWTAGEEITAGKECTVVCSECAE